jgi:DNA (cytosine-5)-methyltransferase 1
MRAIDLFCGAGGASKGLQQAGFEVTGVDIRPQPRYPFRFIQADALTVPLRGYDFIWASPPCQGYTGLRYAPGTRGAPLLIDKVRHRMPDVRWCIENVEGAAWALRDPIRLCGSMFDLCAQGCRLQRHRLFECNFAVPQLTCRHDKRPVIGVYGGHARKRAKSAGGRGTRDIWRGGHKTAAAEAFGIDWMTLTELSEAIPPAYAKFIAEAAT